MWAIFRCVHRLKRTRLGRVELFGADECIMWQCITSTCPGSIRIGTLASSSVASGSYVMTREPFPSDAFFLL